MARATIPSEKAETKNATVDTFEEIYTNLDAHANSFIYPLRWLEDPSQNKKIAVRKMEVFPTACDFALVVCSTLPEPDPDRDTATNLKVLFKIDESDTLISGLNMLVWLIQDQQDFELKHPQLRYNYDTQKNILTLTFEDNVGNQLFDFSHTEVNSLDAFLRFLNQPVNAENRRVLTDSTVSKVFTNVWNRQSLFFHADFSTSKRQVIGCNHDFYPFLNMLYPPPTCSTTFSVRFSTDGVHYIELNYPYRLQLCFIVNYNHSLAF